MAGKKMPVRTADIAFTGDYEGFTATVRTNPTYGAKLDLTSGDPARFERAIAEIVREWNVTDENGEPVPAGNVAAVPDDLLEQLVNQWSEALAGAAKLPKA